jgi:hypothetical protein
MAIKLPMEFLLGRQLFTHQPFLCSKAGKEKVEGYIGSLSGNCLIRKLVDQD